MVNIRSETLVIRLFGLPMCSCALCLFSVLDGFLEENKFEPRLPNTTFPSSDPVKMNDAHLVLVDGLRHKGRQICIA